MFVQKEAEGAFPADRRETVLSAIFYCVYWSAVYHGMKPDVVEKYINEAEIVKPKKWKEPTVEELRRRQIAEDRAMFAVFAARNGIDLTKGSNNDG